MAPRVIRLERESVGKAPVHPKLKRIVRRVASRLIAHNRTEACANAAGVNLRPTDAIRIEPGDLSDLQPGARYDVIVGQASPPDVPSLVPDVRGFDHGILYNLVSDSDVVLPTIWRAEVCVSRKELGVRTYSRDRVLQPGLDRIQAATGARTFRQGIFITLPSASNRRDPGRIAGHSEKVSDDLRTA